MGQGHLEDRKQLQERIALLESQLAAYEQAAGEVHHIRENLRETAEALQFREQALEATSQGIVLADASRPERPVLYVNPSFARITGLAADKLLGRPLDFLSRWATDPEAAD